MEQKLAAPWVCTALMRIGTRMAAGFDQHFVTFGVTQAQFRILLALSELGGGEGIAPSTLAAHLMLERPTVSVLTNRMVERGWLKRTKGANRRTFLLVLDEAGRELLIRMTPHAISLAEATLSSLHSDDLCALRSALESIEAHLRGVSTADECPVPAPVGGRLDKPSA